MHKINLIDPLDKTAISDEFLYNLENKICAACGDGNKEVFATLFLDNEDDSNCYLTTRCKNCFGKKYISNKLVLSDKDLFYLKCTNRI